MLRIKLCAYVGHLVANIQNGAKMKAIELNSSIPRVAGAPGRMHRGRSNQLFSIQIWMNQLGQNGPSLRIRSHVRRPVKPRVCGLLHARTLLSFFNLLEETAYPLAISR